MPVYHCQIGNVNYLISVLAKLFITGMVSAKIALPITYEGDAPMSVLGNRIKHLREQASLSQKRLAEALGISNVQLSRYETGDRKPDPDTIRQIADYFDVSVDYLLGRDTPSKSSPDLDDPELTILFRSLQSASPEIREETRKFLEFLMEKEKDRKPGDTQGYK